MVSAEAEVEAKVVATTEAPSSPRISFSADLLNDAEDFISISPGVGHFVDKDDDTKDKDKAKAKAKAKSKAADFEFLSVSEQRMLSADELFFEGKLLPFWQMQHSEKLTSISLLKIKDPEVEGGEMMMMRNGEEEEEEEKRVSWFLDEDPSPRPPKCTVLWKELLRLKKQRGPRPPPQTLGLSPSSSSSSTSSSSSSLGDAAKKEEIRKEEKEKEKEKKKDKEGKRNNNNNNNNNIKKGLERTRSASSMRIRPILNVPLCTSHPKSSPLPPLFPLLKKGKIDRPSS